MKVEKINRINPLKLLGKNQTKIGKFYLQKLTLADKSTGSCFIKLYTALFHSC